jgi:hypothetical protein
MFSARLCRMVSIANTKVLYCEIAKRVDLKCSHHTHKYMR